MQKERQFIMNLQIKEEKKQGNDLLAPLKDYKKRGMENVAPIVNSVMGTTEKS